MPLALGIMALMIFVIAIRGNYQQAGTLFNQTFFGTGSKSGFFVWAGSLFGLAIIFRLIQAPKAGEMFIALLMIVYFLDNQSVLSNIDSAIQSTGGATATPSTAK